MNDAERLKAIYNFEKVDHLSRREFYIWEESKERWKTEGWDGDESIFKYDVTNGEINVPMDLGWTDIPVVPAFKEAIIDRNEKYEYVRTSTGEIRIYPIGIRHGVMPEFYKAPVECTEDWYNIIKPRLNPDTPERWENYNQKIIGVKEIVTSGQALLVSRIIGGYMYLRSLCGPEKLLYLFYDEPELIKDMMKTWLKLQITCLTKIQRDVPFFKLFLGEDIAYKNGPLISPIMVEEFLMPYYRELIQTLKNGQNEFMHIELDSDGNPDILLPLYIKNGFTAWSPCEVAAGCDPIEMAKKYPNLVIIGGIDKRILAKGKEEIKKELDRIIPFMKKRGGFIPTCDHGVPCDVSFENYLFYRNYMEITDSF